MSIKEEVWASIFNWESCDDVKSPTEEDKINFAISLTQQKMIEDEIKFLEETNEILDSMIIKVRIEELKSKMEKGERLCQ